MTKGLWIWGEQQFQGTKELWKMCNGSLSYTEDLSSVIAYHRNFSLKSELRALIYRYRFPLVVLPSLNSRAFYRVINRLCDRSILGSGDHDMSIPHLSTRGWILALNMTMMDSWRAWYHSAQVAGWGSSKQESLHFSFYTYENLNLTHGQSEIRYTEEYTLNDYVLNFVTVKVRSKLMNWSLACELFELSLGFFYLIWSTLEIVLFFPP